jgi:hypothetical protein
MTSRDDTDDETLAHLQRFILEHVRSPEELDVLLLLFRAAGYWHSAADVAKRLYLTVGAAGRALERLSGAFLDVRIEGEVRFRFATKNSEREHLTARLAEAYRDNRTWVMQLVSRLGAAQDFADAFRLKEKKP